MSVAYPPQESTFIACSIKTRRPILRHGVAEIEMRWNANAADAEGGKKVSKEIARERQKEKDMDAQRMIENSGAVMGGYGYWLQEANSLREAIGRERHRRLVSFLKFQRTLERTYVPEARKEITEKMQERFGTTDYQELKASIIQEAIADPQLSVLVRKAQVIVTTRKGQQEYSDARKAIEMSDVKR